MSQLSDSVAFIGIGSSAIARHSDRSLTAFALDAAVAAIADAGLQREDIDGYVGAPSATNAGALHADGADELSMRLLAEKLGLKTLIWGADLYWDFPTGMAVAAAHALRSGACNYVLGVRAMHHPSGVNYAAPASDLAAGEGQFYVPFGYRTAGARFAMRARDYMANSGASRRDLYAVVELARANAARNPLAVWRGKALSLDEYLHAPMIAEPLCRYDCDMPICGAAAFVMTRGDLAPRAPHRPVYLAGSAGWQQPEAIFSNTRRAREDVQLAQIYDGFSSMVFPWLERFGWAEDGAGWKMIRDGRCAAGGDLPLNTFGGSLGEGRLHGMGHLREAILQLSGRAETRQVANAENCLVQVGPHDFSSVVMLSTDPQ